MPTRNRGKESSDNKLFAAKWHPVFTDAADDLCFLLSRGYAQNSSLQIVGNRYRLNKRQQDALRRLTASADEVKRRSKSVCEPSVLKGEVLEIDGFNLLILLESAMSGAYVFKGRDGTFRDISSVHGSYKRVQKTQEAILMVGNALQALEVKSTKWYLDQPVSNSGRLKTLLMEISREYGFDWEVELVLNPDTVLVKSDHIVVTTDGWILDNVDRWFNFGAYLFEQGLDREHVLVF
ncbi:MAG: DUF434 domain-containing protein [Bacteroidia bacterium]